jgi:hypothetical protein
MLQADGHDRTKALHQPGDGRSLFRHPNEYLARLAVRIQADCHIAFMSADREVMRDRCPLVRKMVAIGSWRPDEFRALRFGPTWQLAPVPRILSQITVMDLRLSTSRLLLHEVC